jgi:hypothetical protein
MPIATNCRQKFSQANHFYKSFPENLKLLPREVPSFQACENGLGLPLRQEAWVIKTIAYLEIAVNKDKAIPAYR